MVNYQQGKIYKIYNDEKCYYGSTCEPTISHRLAKHNRAYKLYLANKGPYYTSFEIIKSGSYDIVLLENCPCNSKDELRARERYWIENNECINKKIPNRTRKEYCEANKEHSKQYYQTNKEHIRKQQQEYRENNKQALDEIANERHICSVCGGKYVTSHKSHHEKTKKHLKALF